MRLLKRLLPIVFIVLLAGAGYWVYRTQNATPQTVAAVAGYTQLVRVTEGNVSASLTVVGQIAAVQQSDLTFDRMNGTAKLQKLQVKAGNTVTAGQVLATIDPAPYKQAVDQAKSDLTAAEEKLATLKTPPTALALAKADVAVATAQYNLQNAQSNLVDLQDPDIPALTTAVADAQSALSAANATLAGLQNDTAFNDSLTKLLETEAKASAAYFRLAAEANAETYYADAVRLAYNKMMDAQDPRATAEVQRQVDILNAQIKIRQSQKTLSDAQTALATARAGGDPLALAKAQLAAKQAEVALATAQDARVTLKAGSDSAKIAAAQATLDKKKLALTDAQGDLAAASLTAPFNGTILSTNVVQGSQVGPSTKILTMANLAGVQVVASVDETNIKKVIAGQTANVTFDALPGQTLKGAVGEVPLQGALQGGVMVYQVPITLQGADKLPLLVGMTANVKVSLGQVTKVPVVPALAVQRSSNGYQVTVPNAADPTGQPTIVAVQIGLSDGTYTQILSGLKVGDQVLAQLGAKTTTSNQGFPGGPGGDFTGPPPGAGGR